MINKILEPLNLVRAGRQLAVIMLMWSGLCMTSAAIADDDLSRLRAEITDMRSSFEAKIVELERQIVELQAAQTDGPPSATAMATGMATTTGMAANTNTPPGGTEEAQTAAIEAALSKYDVNRGLTFEGYFRSGKGIDDAGNIMEPFQAPVSQAKYRLGNEGETYIETAFGYTFPELDLPEGKEFAIALRPSFVAPDERFRSEPAFSIREAYALSRGAWEAQPEAAFWAGQRFYDRWDVHLNDFFYYDMSGFGGGVEDVRLGNFGKLAVAWIGGSIDVLVSNGSNVSNDVNTKNTLDLRLSDFDLLAGKGFVGVNLASSQDSFMPNGINVVVDGSNGLAGFLGYENSKVFGGRYKVMLQYGVGAASNFRATEPDYSLLNPPDAPAPPLRVDQADSWHARLVNDLVIEPTDRLSMQATLVYDEFDSGIEGPSKRRWVSLGVRPIHSFSDFFSLAVEAGVDHTGGDGLSSGELYKLTVAPQITPGKGYFKRPAIRMFVTYAAWSDAFRGLIAPQNYGTETEGINIGVQAEAWW